MNTKDLLREIAKEKREMKTKGKEENEPEESKGFEKLEKVLKKSGKGALVGGAGGALFGAGRGAMEAGVADTLAQIAHSKMKDGVLTPSDKSFIGKKGYLKNMGKRAIKPALAGGIGGAGIAAIMALMED